MGNVLSDETDEREEKFLEEGFNLESPDADKQINFGTAAPVWQNAKHGDDNDGDNDDDDIVDGRASGGRDSNGGPSNQGQEVVMQQDQRESLEKQEPKKLSYLQMAKLGYQELVNAIIRPPRADYKVTSDNNTAIWVYSGETGSYPRVVQTCFSMSATDGGTWSAGLYLLRQAFYSNRLYTAHTARAEWTRRRFVVGM
jgi:hypothetical protein